MREFKRFGSCKDWTLLLLACGALLYVCTYPDALSSRAAGSASAGSAQPPKAAGNLRSEVASQAVKHSFFDFNLKDIEGNDVSFAQRYQGTGMKALLVVNVASN